MRAILIGERMNRATYRPTCWPDVSGARYWRLQLRFGAFRDCASRLKLGSLGVEWTDAANLLPPDPQGVCWDATRAREAAIAWLPRLRGYDLAWLAGARVLAAFGVDRRGRTMAELVGRFVDLGGVPAVPVPHPSGLNHWWNDPRNPGRFRRRLRHA